MRIDIQKFNACFYGVHASFFKQDIYHYSIRFAEKLGVQHHNMCNTKSKRNITKSKMSPPL